MSPEAHDHERSDNKRDGGQARRNMSGANASATARSEEMK
jgi:hypothetical protein